MQKSILNSVDAYLDHSIDKSDGTEELDTLVLALVDKSGGSGLGGVYIGDEKGSNIEGGHVESVKRRKRKRKGKGVFWSFRLKTENDSFDI